MRNRIHRVKWVRVMSAFSRQRICRISWIACAFLTPVAIAIAAGYRNGMLFGVIVYTLLQFAMPVVVGMAVEVMKRVVSTPREPSSAIGPGHEATSSTSGRGVPDTEADDKG